MTHTQDSVTQMVRVQMALRREKQADLAGVLGIAQPSVSKKLTGQTSCQRTGRCPFTELVRGPVAYLPTGSESVNGRERTAPRRVRGGTVLVLPTQRTHFSEVAA